MQREVLRALWLDAAELELRVRRMELAFGHKYRPDQARVPAGQPDGGQWVDEGRNKPDQVRHLSTSKDGVIFITDHEAFIPRVYIDLTGHETIGYGHKLLPNESFPNGITKEEARALFAQDIKIVERVIHRRVKVPINQHQFDALASLAYNIGTGPERFSGSMVLRLLNQGDYNGAADHFMDWNKGWDKIARRLVVRQGLVNRRNAERNLFLNGVYR